MGRDALRSRCSRLLLEDGKSGRNVETINPEEEGLVSSRSIVSIFLLLGEVGLVEKVGEKSFE